MRQLVYSPFSDNNLVPYHLWCKVYKYIFHDYRADTFFHLRAFWGKLNLLIAYFNKMIITLNNGQKNVISRNIKKSEKIK